MSTVPDILQINQLTKQYSCGHRALDGVSLSIKRGECAGLVGESGSGKSTLAKCTLLLEGVDGGEVWLNGQPLHSLKKKEQRGARKQMQTVFQNPAASFNPKLKMIDSLLEPLEEKKGQVPGFLAHACESRERMASALLDMVGLDAAHLYAYPHELSGGQKQRAAIARAISTEPSLIILDEPTASLDVLVQADILQLLRRLQQELGLSYLFISHDLAAVYSISDRIFVMKNGQIEDVFESKDLYAEERHTYTKTLVHLFEQ